MGRRGPKPEPASVKVAKGNAGHRPIGDDPNIDESTTGKGVASVEAPEWLSEAALEIWERLAPRLIAQKLLFAIDAETFGRYCTIFAEWHMANKLLQESGGTVYESESPHGVYKRLHPAFAVADRTNRSLERMESTFGLNPAERQRIFAARAAGSFGDLFGGDKGKSKAATGSEKNAPAASTSSSPRGMLLN